MKNFNFLFRPKTKIWSQNANFFAWKEDRLTFQWALIFCVDVHMALALSHVHMRSPESDPLSPSVWTS